MSNQNKTLELSADMKIALEAARLFLSKTEGIDIDGDSFWPVSRTIISSMRHEAATLINYIEK